VTYSRWLSLRLSSAELWSFAIFFLLIGLILPGWFFIGGAFSCALTGFQHWNYSRKHTPVLPQLQEEPAHLQEPSEIH
jgi:hypothetical protein